MRAHIFAGLQLRHIGRSNPRQLLLESVRMGLQGSRESERDVYFHTAMCMFPIDLKFSCSGRIVTRLKSNVEPTVFLILAFL